MQQHYFVHISEAINVFLGALADELLDHAERFAPLRGPVLPEQRPYSVLLDWVLAEGRSR